MLANGRKGRTSIIAGSGALGVAGLLGLVATWWVVSKTTQLVPSIGEVASAAPEFLQDPSTYADIVLTLGRVAGAFVAAIAAAFPMAFAIAKRRPVGQILSVYVNLLLGVPSTIAALIALFVFRRSPIGVFVVIWIIILPYIVVTLVEGLRARDTTLDQVAHVYRFSRLERIRHVIVPHLVPYTFAAIRNEHAHAWRVAVVAELFAVTTGMGARFSRAFDRFVLVDVILWLGVFFIAFLFVEYVVVRPSERYALRWRTVV